MPREPYSLNILSQRNMKINSIKIINTGTDSASKNALRMEPAISQAKILTEPIIQVIFQFWALVIGPAIVCIA
jgi:hypothetical protein